MHREKITCSYQKTFSFHGMTAWQDVEAIFWFLEAQLLEKPPGVILPNLMHASGSYVVADPSGELLKRSRAALRQKGYAIRVLDFANPAASDGYNPLLYSVDAEDTLNLTRCLLENTEPGNKVNDPFWEKSETALFNAVFAFLVRRRQGEKCTLHEAHRLVSIAAERGGEFDALFEEARKRKPNDPSRFKL